MKTEFIIVVVLSALVALWGQSVPARAADCNGNGTADNLEPDCNANGLPDDCDIAGKLYWTDSGLDKITRSYLNGTRVETVITLSDIQNTPRGIAVDPVGGHIYWTDVATMSIRRANLDGSNVVGIVTTELVSPRDVALDLDAGKMYWSDSGTDSIRRANLDGSDIGNVVIGLQTPFGIALDVAGGKIYWIESVSTGPKVQRANLDGSDVQNLVTTGLQVPHYIALDLVAGKMYWTDNAANRVQRANLDGTTVQTIVSNTVAMAPTGIAVDTIGGKIYWGNNGDDSIYWANLDGTQPDDLILAAQDPYGITIAFPVADADENGIPDECEGTPGLVSAASGKPNAMGPGGFCDLPIDLVPDAPITSEPRDGGITEVIFTYDGLAVAGTVTVESDCTCPSPPSYAPIDPSVSCVPDEDTLVCTFDPALTNACTYRFTVASASGTASVELRGLRGDIDSSGRTNATDRSTVVSVWTGPNFSCDTDLDSSGRTNATDRSSVVSSWTGGQNCAP